MVTDNGAEGTVYLDTAMERLEDVISSECVGSIDVFVDEDTTSQPKETWMCILSSSQRGTRHSPE